MSAIRTLKFILNHPLTRENRVKALMRFLRWQIGSRLNPYPVVYPFVEGTYLVMEKGMAGATGNLYTGLHEFSDMSFLLHLLREDDCFVDIGANIGSYTVLASGVCRATSIAVEPGSITFDRLERNIKINKLEKVTTLLKVGLGSEKTTKWFTKSLDTVNHILAEQEQEQEQEVEEVHIETLDSIIGVLDSPLLLKIDVEGFETEVLNGSKETLENKNLMALIIELNGSGSRYGYDEEAVHEKLVKLGFREFKYNPFERKLIKIMPEQRSDNSIYIRDTEFVESRIKTSRRIKILDINF